jgi:hypothetical protein
MLLPSAHRLSHSLFFPNLSLRRRRSSSSRSGAIKLRSGAVEPRSNAIKSSYGAVKSVCDVTKSTSSSPQLDSTSHRVGSCGRGLLCGATTSHPCEGRRARARPAWRKVLRTGFPLASIWARSATDRPSGRGPSRGATTTRCAVRSTV